MCSTHLHSLSVCQSLHRPCSLFVSGSARFISMISYFSKGNRYARQQTVVCPIWCQNHQNPGTQVVIGHYSTINI